MCVRVCMCVPMQVLRDLIIAINPSVTNSLLGDRVLHYLLKLDGKQQQKQTPPICTLATGEAGTILAHVQA